MHNVTKLLFLMLFVSTTWAAPNGDLLYKQYCESCHGTNGSGGLGVPLSLPSFQATVSDAYLFRTIREGRPGRLMPSYQHLSDAQLDAIVSKIRTWSSVKAPIFKQARLKGNAKKGKLLYVQHCAACHGASGEGGKGTGVTFSRPREWPIIAPSLNNAGFQASVSDEMIKAILVKGRKGTPMQSYSKSMNSQQMNDLISYVRTLNKPEPINVDKQENVIEFESSEPMKETLDALKAAIIGANFRIIRVQKFEDGYVKKGSENPKKIIIYFCNFNMLNKALAIDPRVGMFLPCRITLIERNGKVKMLAMNTTAMSRKFNNRELDKLCLEMKELYENIMDEAAL